MSSERLKLVDDETLVIEAALQIAEERENTTRDLARAVLDDDLITAKKLAKELLPNETGRGISPRKHRIAGR